ncbi:hypothetical protein N7491_001274 [Penicillium cf. griseofulvum]|uniref:Uncharacterized protein n=1 Tax=Penicillium cf. griseofulvum TaxID=2972120 RepID=A0A9W9M9M9_9EURO|nr:hypothetical protein N7472_006409 [Penicillium cf. griseofulvum]KAJ5445192.1 hypothetical protein N7491_001274 [Penicillium cf. griseofulvum]KAJ5446915.1 hypothetical protein N7445_001736 [Penicillium cf. griseofulvum]
MPSYRFLAGYPAYERYITEVATGQLVMPGYEYDSKGSAIVHPGEAYCRHDKCKHKIKRAQETRNLRGHLKRHDGGKFAIRAGRTGRLTTEEEEDALLWYDSLFATMASTAKGVPPRPSWKKLKVTI